MHNYEDNHINTEASKTSGINERRRSMLKWIAVGSGAFVLGKILGPGFTFFGESSLLGKTHLFKNFRVRENDDELSFYDNFGNEILVLEKDPHAGE